ncbi:Protein Wnt [Aphelenchoides besseyi]|nr:Protein Wnt [Aphelenchoides besseyi]
MIAFQNRASMFTRRVLFLAAVLSFFSTGFCIKWLAMHKVSPPWSESNQCPSNRTERKEFGLVTYQSRMCRRIPELMPVIVNAAKLALNVCQNAFAEERWNCSTLLLAPDLRSDLTKGTKEQAFVHALSSAAVTHQVAKACVSGQLNFCPCGYVETTTAPGSMSNSDAYKWKGCSDNVVYGKRVSREWADAMWRRLPQFTLRKRKSVLEFDGEHLNEEPIAPKAGPKARMNQHNNDVGRVVTQQSLLRKCKCHGVSSGCDVKTCWYTLPDLKEIAQQLKERYDLAHQIGQTYDTTGSKSDSRITRDPFNTKLEPELVSRLTVKSIHLFQIYLRGSPTYCDENLDLGSLGTRDRECKLNTTDSSSCKHLCCARGFNTRQMTVEEQCRCKFVYCCAVKCKICQTVVEKHYCK